MTEHDVLDLRPAITQHLEQRLRAFHEGFRQNLALVGPTGSGKTTVVSRVLSRFDGRFAKIICPLQQDSPKAFLKRLACAVASAAVPAAPGESIEQLLVRVTTVAPKTAAVLERASGVAGHQSQIDGFVQVLDAVALLHQELHKPCVLVLDEFLYLEHMGVSHAFHELGKRVMTWPFTLFIMTSSATSRAQEILRERLHLLFGQFELISLGPVEPSAAVAWMDQQAPSLRPHPAIARFLLDWLGQSPWYLNVTLNRLQELARLKRRPKMPEQALTHALWDLLGSADGALHQWCAAQLERVVSHPHGVMARDALLAVAQGARTTQAVTQACGSRRVAAVALQQLVEHDLLQRKGTCWVIADPLLACWLRAVLAPAQTTHPEGRRTFERVIQESWSRWSEAADQSLATRIQSLLTKFQNETIAMDHKVGRLPVFDRIEARLPADVSLQYVVADGPERRWCCLVSDGRLDEAAVSAFEQFCRSQVPRPVRKIVMARHGFELNAKLLAKDANMWVWEPDDVNMVLMLYGQPPLSRS